MRLLALFVASITLLVAVSAREPAVARADTAFQMNVPVLMYHRIQCPDPTTTYVGLFLCPALFDQQLALLESQGWHTITGDQLVEDLVTQSCPQPKTFVITIDDGALDGYTAGAPILEKHGFHGTFSMVVGKAGDYLTNPALSKPHFDWDQARDLVARGHGVANHTMWHRDIGAMSTDELDSAVGDAQDKLVQELGFGPRVFVYPAGSVGSAAAYLSSRFGLAFTTETGAVEASTDPMLSPRLRVDGTESAAAVLNSMSPYANPCAGSTATGTIHIGLHSRPHRPKAFTFSVSNGGGTFTLTDGGMADARAGIDLSVPTGTYTVSVAAQAGWTLTALTCTEPEAIKRARRKVTINLPASGNVSCTFAETRPR